MRNLNFKNLFVLVICIFNYIYPLPLFAEEYVPSNTLPILYINVYRDSDKKEFDDEIINKDLDHKNYFSNAEYYLDVNGCKWLMEEGIESIGDKDNPLPLEIKARGNFTRVRFSKKPFKIKLREKKSLLGLSKSKHFALLAHADDCFGYLRNYIGFNLGHRIGLPWTPSQQPLELVINGDYRGLYFLTESIRVEEGRINITELKDNETDSSLISGGYIVEIDNTNQSNQIVLEQKTCVEGHLMKDLMISWESPEEYSELQKKFITDQFTAINNAVGNDADDILWRYIDLDDAARYYLVKEIIGDTEAYSGSTFLFRDRGENQKWHFCPIWDCGQAFLSDTQNYFYDVDTHGNVWIPSIRTNAKFNSKVEETWLWFMNSAYNGIEEDIEIYVDQIREGAIADHLRWAGQPTPEGGIEVFNNSNMNKRKEIVLDYLSERIQWMKTKFGDFEINKNFSEPVRDTTPAMPLPDYAVSKIDVINASNNSLEFWNLQGIKINNPIDGQLYIIKNGNKTYKCIYRIQ